jgi:Zn-dependent protease
MILNLLYSDLPMNITVGLLILQLFCVVMALTVHEFAHGFIANKLGDPTASFQGRLTLNPLAHIDPVGFLMMLLVGFGWAKPVPVNPRLMSKPKRDMALTSIAGPAVNLLVALVSGIAVGALAQFGYNPLQIFREAFDGGITPMGTLSYTLYMMMLLNVGLALFNMIPIPPLDGSNVLVAFLPNNTAAKYLQIRYYTRYIFGGLMLISFLSDRFALFYYLDIMIWYPFEWLRENICYGFMRLGELIFSFI